MDHKDIRTLKILERIDKEQPPSQRDLANELNISLGLVNSFIKRLANKGYFKISTIPKNRVRYIMTPEGIAKKTRLTYEYIRHSHQFYTEARQRLRNLYRQLEEDGCYRIVFYGASDFAEIAYISCQGSSIDLVSIIDDQKAGGRFFDKEIKTSSSLIHLSYDRILITALYKTREIIYNLISTGMPDDKIIRF